MSNYVQTTIFTPKDALPTSDPNKTIFGAAYDVEFGNISTAIASKYDVTNLATTAQAVAGLSAGTLITPATLSAALSTGNIVTGYFVDTGAVNAMVITPATALTAYTAGQRFRVKIALTNTATAVTLNVNGLGAKNVTNPDLSVPAIGSLIINNLVTLAYDGTQFQIQSGQITTLHGNITLAAPTSGATLTVAMVNLAAVGVLFAGTSRGIRFGTTGTLSTIDGVDNTGIASYQPLIVSGSTVALGIAGVAALSIAATGGVTIAAPSSGLALTATAVANARVANFISPNTAGQSFGPLIKSGTNNTDDSFVVNNAANSLTYFNIRGDGQSTIFEPSFSAAALKNAATTDSGTFTVTLQGCTTAPTATANWSRNGNVVTLVLPALTATSNSTVCSYTGLPASLQPATLASVAPCTVLENNTVINLTGVVTVTGSSSIIFGLVGGGSGFTAAGTKGLNNTHVMSYPLT